MFKLFWRKKGDEDQDVSSELTPMEMTVHCILNTSGLRNLLLSSCVVKAVRAQLAKMNNTASKAMKSGGKTFRTLMGKWRAEEESYRLKAYFNEMDVNHYISDNNRLRSLKQKYHEKFHKENEKRDSLERSFEPSTKCWKTKFKNLAHKLRKLKNRQKKKPTKMFSSYSAHHQARLKANFKQECQSALSFLGLYDLVPTKVECFNFEHQHYDTISLIDDDEYVPLVDTNKTSLTLTNEEVDLATHLLYIKDKFHISDEAWKELSATSENFPSIYSIKKGWTL